MSKEGEMTGENKQDHKGVELTEEEKRSFAAGLFQGRVEATLLGISTDVISLKKGQESLEMKVDDINVKIGKIKTRISVNAATISLLVTVLLLLLREICFPG